jgi:hypothetical protein
MHNNRGSVILLVMLLLGVVTLIAVGALVMSIYDQKFTSALKSYDKGFNLADGAAALAFGDLVRQDREQDIAFTDPLHPPPAKTIFCQCADPANCRDASTPRTEAAGTVRGDCKRSIERIAGNYDSEVRMLGYTSQAPSGWEVGSYYTQYWTGTGVASPTLKTDNTAINAAYRAMVETSVTKTPAK